MIEKARTWRLLIGGVATAMAAVVGFAGASASAEPVLPQPPLPVPVPVTQTVAVAAGATGLPMSAGATGLPMSAGATGFPMSADPAAAVGPTGPQPGVATLNQSSGLPVAAPSTAIPATTGTLADYFKDKGVTLDAQTPQNFTALNIVLPMPPGWSTVPDPNVPNAFMVIADRTDSDGLYTANAQVTVYKLNGSLDPRDAITHGYLDSQQLSGWQTTDASLADFSGFPSSIIEGTYRANDQTLNTSRRHIIASAGPDNYLVSLAVTTSVDEAVATAAGTDAIVNGFRVTAAGSPAPPPPAPIP